MLLLLSLACKPAADLVITVPEDQAGAFADFVLFLDDDRVALHVEGEPGGRAGVTEIAVVAGPPCAECFSLSAEEGGKAGTITVAAGDLLGAQYGAAAALEAMGWRFWHPADPLAPEEIAAVDALPEPLPEGMQSPAVARRGVHLHTIHPIEGLEAFWMSDDDTEARRVMDWLIKNRGNHLQWVGLDDISGDAAVLAAWQARTAAHIGNAHRRGITAGVGLQLYGASNLQRGFDLVDQPGAGEEAQIAERLGQLTDGLDWDVLNLSFGEFSGQEPQDFIDGMNRAYAGMQAAIPGVDVPATIHVGDYPDLRVEYEGEELLYYFLVKYADPGIRPWVHTVMYYDLFEDAGGAYLHEDFSEHRAFLEERIQAGGPVGYFPESAYWVAFDNPVPLYNPLYARSRLLDLARLPGLADHVVFSSGWEWGYWQGDLASLRGAWGMYGLSAGEKESAAGQADPEADAARTAAFFDDMYAPLGEAGAALARAAAEVAEIQHRRLLLGRLAPWMAGRDAFMDAGDGQGVIAQPDRATEAEILAMDAAARAALLSGTVEPLEAMAGELEAVLAEIPAASSPEVSGLTAAGARAAAEVRDGVEVDAARARFAAARLRALLAGAEGDAAGASAQLAAMRDHLAAGRAAVARRHGDMHDPDGARWIAESWDNPTIYRFGYLLRADQLCFWERERIQAERLLIQSQDVIPTCAI